MTNVPVSEDLSVTDVDAENRVAQGPVALADERLGVNDAIAAALT